MLHYRVLAWAMVLALVVGCILLASRGGRGCLAWLVGIAGILALLGGFVYALARFAMWAAQG